MNIKKQIKYITALIAVLIFICAEAIVATASPQEEWPTSGEKALEYCEVCHSNIYARQVQVLYNLWDSADDPLQKYFNCSRCHFRVEEIPYLPYKTSCEICHINGNPGLGLTSGIEDITNPTGVEGIGVLHKIAEENTGLKVHGDVPGTISIDTCGQCHTRHVITDITSVYTSTSGCVDHKMCMCDYCAYSVSIGLKDPSYTESLVSPLTSIEEIKKSISKASQMYEELYETITSEGLPQPLEEIKQDCGKCHWMVYENFIADIKAKADIGKGIPHDPTIILEEGSCNYCHIQKTPENPFVPSVLYADVKLQATEWLNKVVEQAIDCTTCHFVYEDGRIGPVITTLGFQHVAYSEWTSIPIHSEESKPISVESCGKCHNDHYDTMNKWETPCKTSCHDTSVERPFITSPMDPYVLERTNGHVCGRSHCFCLCDLGYEWHRSHYKSGLAKTIREDLSKAFTYDQRFIGNRTLLQLINVWRLKWEGLVPPTTTMLERIVTQTTIITAPPITETITKTIRETETLTETVEKTLTETLEKTRTLTKTVETTKTVEKTETKVETSTVTETVEKTVTEVEETGYYLSAILAIILVITLIVAWSRWRR